MAKDQSSEKKEELMLAEIDWRYTAKKVRLGPFDANIVLPPLILFAVHIKIWTFVLAVFVMISMWLIELFFEMPLSTVFRTVRRALAGKRRSVVPWWKVNKL